MTRHSLAFLGLCSLCVLSCVSEGDLQNVAADEHSVRTPLNITAGSKDSSGHPEACASSCSDSLDIVGTWQVLNYGHGLTGKVTFRADNVYTIDGGTYNAGGTWLGASFGTYKLLPGRAIAFTYGANPKVNRIAVIQCATADRIVHFTMGHTHDYEALEREVAP